VKFQPANLGALCCLHVLDKRHRVDVVFHEDDGGWQFLCAADHAAEGPEAFDIVGVEHLVERQPELDALADLPPGWMAERRGDRWRRRAEARR
jgi:hypothetical protein